MMLTTNDITLIEEAEFFFNDLASEAEKYFDFLNLVVTSKHSIFSIQHGNPREIDDDISHTLKAAAYLIIYNLIEATVQKTINAIHYELANSSFDDLCTSLKIHILKKFKSVDLDISAANINKFSPLQTAIQQLSLEKAKIFSGNLDARRIQDIAKLYNIDFKMSGETQGGCKLKNIKIQRNNLAHGSRSFVEVGKDTSIEEINEAKNETISFLKDFINCSKNYLENSCYLNSSASPSVDEVIYQSPPPA